MQGMRKSISDVEALCLGLTVYLAGLPILAMMGLVCGLGISKWMFPFSLALSALLGYSFAPSHKVRCSLAIVGIVLASIALSSIPVMYVTWDADWCYRACVYMMHEGWNPFSLISADALAAKWPGISPWHVLYAQKFFVYSSACLYLAFGFGGVSDSLTIVSIIVAFLMLRQFLVAGLGMSRVAAVLFTLAALACPHVIMLVFGGKHDPIMYAYLLVLGVSMLSYQRTRRLFDLVMISSAAVLMFGVKALGLKDYIVFSLAFYCFECYMARKAKKPFHFDRKYLLSCSLTIAVCVLSNWAPLATVAFQNKEPIEKVANALTGDFHGINDDARAMGYVGRFVSSYVSEKAANAYYARKLNQGNFKPEWFNPDVHAGLGVSFKVFFMLSLALLIAFVRDPRIWFLYLATFASALLIPERYVGYGRYVGQIYLLPVLVAIGLWERFPLKFVKGALWGAMGCFVVLLSVDHSVGKHLLLVAINSMENLEFWGLAKAGQCERIEASSLPGRSVWTHDACLDIPVSRPGSCDTEAYRYSPWARRYTVVAKHELDVFGAADILDEKPMTTFLRGSYLPRLKRSLLGGGGYVADWFLLRMKQLSRAWRGE